MSARGITEQLERIATGGDFAARSAQMAEAWARDGAGLDFVEPILRFLEEHPALTLGAQAGLAHFVERFHGLGYEAKLTESIGRKPTSSTVWMLHRMIGETQDGEARRSLIMALKRARMNPHADQAAMQAIARYLKEIVH